MRTHIFLPQTILMTTRNQGSTKSIVSTTQHTRKKNPLVVISSSVVGLPWEAAVHSSVVSCVP